jgi:hypothetical protein
METIFVVVVSLKEFVFAAILINKNKFSELKYSKKNI